MGEGKLNGGGWGNSFNIPQVLVKQKEKLNSNTSHCLTVQKQSQNRTGTGATYSGSGQPVWLLLWEQCVQSKSNHALEQGQGVESGLLMVSPS